KARPRTLLIRRVTRKQRGNQFARAIRESGDHATEVRKIFRSPSRALDLPGIEVDVLCAAIRPLRIEKPLFFLLECKRELGQHENVAALERVRQRFSARSRNRGMPAREFERSKLRHGVSHQRSRLRSVAK